MQKEWISTDFYYTHRTKHWRATKVLYGARNELLSSSKHKVFLIISVVVVVHNMLWTPSVYDISLHHQHRHWQFICSAHICYALIAAAGETFRHNIAFFFAYRPTRFYISFTKKLPKWRHKMKWVMRWVRAFYSDAAAFGPAECVRKKVLKTNEILYIFPSRLPTENFAKFNSCVQL